jgi:hypothetical protein
LSFWVASTALLTSSRRKISWSEYKNFLIIGKMFSVWMEMEPVSDIGLAYRYGEKTRKADRQPARALVSQEGQRLFQ